MSDDNKPLTRLGTCTATKSGGQVTADIDGYTRTVEIARDLTVAAGDIILVHRVNSMWVACCRIFTAAPAAVENDAVPNPQPATITGVSTFAPESTGSYRSSRWRTDTTDVVQGADGAGANNTGAVFYGDGPGSLSGATVTLASVQIRRASTGAFTSATSTLRLATEKVRPAGAPTLTSTTTGPAPDFTGEPSSFVIPNAYAQAMVDGTAGGLAVFQSGGSPFVRFAGRADWAPAWTLTLEWSRPA